MSSFNSYILTVVLTYLIRVFPPVPSPFTDPESKETQEEFDSLFDSVAEGLPSPKEEVPPPLSDNDLAVFDPCYKQGDAKINVNLII